MNILKRVLALASNLLFVFLALNALAIVLGFVVNLPVTGGHGHGTIHDAAIGLAFALHTFVWLLPLTALMFFIGSLIGIQTPAANRE